MQVEPPSTLLIKVKHCDKSDKDFVKLKLRRYMTSAKSDLYELKMALFNNVEPEELFLFVCNFNMPLAASGTMGTDTKVQYICTEAFCQFGSLSTDVEGTNILTVRNII